MAFGAYKMSKRDADRVEQHTGVPPEELEDDELDKAMDDLNIEKQKVDASDTEQGSGAPPAAPAVSSTMTQLDELEKLGQLHASGILTDEEFAAKKAQILGL